MFYQLLDEMFVAIFDCGNCTFLSKCGVTTRNEEDQICVLVILNLCHISSNTCTFCFLFMIFFCIYVFLFMNNFFNVTVYI